MNGHKLRILSSENDASVKVQQDQNTNITLKLEHTPSQADLKESAPQINTSPPYAPPGFTPGAPMPTPLAPEQFSAGAYPSVSAVPTASPIQTGADPSVVNYGYVPQVQTRDIDLTADIEDKDRQIEVLESLLSCYENNPLIINKFVVCQYETLMNIIKVLTSSKYSLTPRKWSFHLTRTSPAHAATQNTYTSQRFSSRRMAKLKSSSMRSMRSTHFFNVTASVSKSARTKPLNISSPH